MIKKKNFKRTVTITTASLLAACTIFGFASGVFNTKNNNLPTSDEIRNNLMLFNADTHYSNLHSGLFNEYTFYMPTSTISYFVLDKSITTDQRIAIEDCLNDLNLIFEQINPNYKFEIKEDGSVFDRFNSNIIYVKSKDGFVDKNISAKLYTKYVPTKYGYKTSFNKIVLDNNLNYKGKYSEGGKAFAHEVGHAILGADDCYDTTPYYNSIMNNTKNIEKYYAFNDLILFACKFKKYKTIKEANMFIEFTCEYLEYDKELFLLDENSNSDFFKNVYPPLPFNNNKHPAPIFPNDLEK